MEQDELAFFDRDPAALSLYELFKRRVLEENPSAKIRVQKTQITFSNRYNFACASFLPVGRAKERPDSYLVISFGLGCRMESPRIDAAAEPYPGRWTHHVLLSGIEEIDDELMGWIREAWDFSARKR